MPKQNVPALRLEGFDGEWEESTIGSQAEIVMGQSPHGSSYNTKSAGEVLVQGNADLVDGWVTPRIWTTEPTRIAEPGTLIMSVRAPVGAMGKTRHRVVLGRGVAGIRGNEFIFQYLTKLEQDSYWSSKSSGSTFDSVNGSEIRATQISVPPTLEEQQAIGAIFTNLDAAINQHTLKHTFLQQSKTALMQRMFPQEGQTVPELRLEGFDGEWEDCTLGEHSHVTTGSSDVQDADPDGLYPFFVRSQHVERSNKYLFDGEAILIPGEGRLGEIFHYYIGKFDFHQRVYRISDFEDIDGKYVYWAMQHSFKDHAMKNTVKATVDSLRQPTITGFIFQKPPTLEEQQAIGAVFTNLDQLIVAEARYIKSLKQAKTALLQRMFI